MRVLFALCFALVVTSCTDEPTASTATDVADTSTPDVAAPAPWQHVGPITIAAVPRGAPPWLVDRSTAALPEGVAIPEGRAMVVDFDGDGLDDLVALGTATTAPAKNTPVFLRNAGGWRFEDHTQASGMADEEMVLLVFGDIDNDGDQDAFAGTSHRSPTGKHGVWLNDGAGRFTYRGADGLHPNRLNATVYKEMAAATLVDLDRDGRLDLYLGLFRSGDVAGGQYQPPGNELYRGDGTGVWAEFTLPEQHNPLTSEVDPGLARAQRATYGVCPADFDDDGDMDVFVNNYGAGRPAANDPPSYWEWNFLWKNEGGMAVTDVSEGAAVHATLRGIGGVEDEPAVVMQGKTFPRPVGGNGFSCAWGDIDNDGDLDLAVGSIAHPDYPQTDRLLLHMNPGGAPGAARLFGEESAARGLLYNEDELFPVLVDVDQDGRLDLAVSRLRIPSNGVKRDEWDGNLLLYLQDDAGVFEPQPLADSGVDISRPGPSVWLDADHDGDLDFFLARAGGRVFENVAAVGNHLVLSLVGGPGSPRDATGARVTLVSGVGKQVREVTSGNGHYNNQNTRALHFGLGGDSGAADVTIRWPDGEVQALGDVKANLRLEVVQGGAVTIIE
ncbi:MAG: CRTAC1 family protein [Deltaproteobacteria bacterium]|nr:CRTAC1 family protein [Deltaproteobacteria bacterium]